MDKPWFQRATPMSRRSLWALACVSVCVCLGAASVAAQTATTSTPGTAPDTGTNTGTNIGTYQDRVIDAASLPKEAEDRQASYDNSGLPRGYSLESVWNQRRSQGTRSQSLGLQGNAYFDTLQYGTFSGQASVLRETQREVSNGPKLQAQGLSTWTLRQIGMPFDSGWRANNSLGVLNLPAPDLGSSRLLLPSPGMRGLATQWQNGGLGGAGESVNLTAAWGEAGGLRGFPLGRFDTTQGEYGLLSGQFQTPTRDGVWQGVAALAGSRGTTPSLGLASVQPNERVSTDSLLVSARREWTSPSQAFVQANTLASRSTEGVDTPTATGPFAASSAGLWMDAGFQSGAHEYKAGLFKLDPQLAWAGAPVVSDVRGAQWRHAWRTRAWQTEANLELLDSVSGLQSSGYFANASLRHQYSSSTSFGGALSLRRFAGDGQALMLFSQWGSAWGGTRAQLDIASASQGERQQRIALDHDWSAVQSMRLSTSLSLERERRLNNGGLVSNRSWGAAVNAEWDLGGNLSTSHSLQGRFSEGARQYVINSGLSWGFAPGWSVIGNLYASTGSTVSPVGLAQSPLTPLPTDEARINERGVFIGLRYQQDAGRAQVPLAGVRGQGAGRLEGSVFLDANKNGTREASERGAQNITVLLNGRFAAQTDAQGRFEFPFVASGEHVITVVADNLPLPWSLDKNGRSDARTAVRVFTRETSRVDIGAAQP
jgi:hypothetical protein